MRGNIGPKTNMRARLNLFTAPALSQKKGRGIAHILKLAAVMLRTRLAYD